MTTQQLHFRPQIANLVPYEPGKPAEELGRERGLERVVKLASNEGPWGPLPAAAEAIAEHVEGLNRYPDGACVLLREALAKHYGVNASEVAVGHGADSIINNLSLAMLGPGDNIVCGWPSFPSYVLDARKMGADAIMVPLDADQRYDLDAIARSITDRTRIVCICNPNNPTGTMVGRGPLLEFVRSLPWHVLVVLDEAYSEYVRHPHYVDGISECFDPFGNVAVLRTFSKIYGLAGLRVGYMVAPSAVVQAVDKVRNAFDVTSLAQVAAVASLGQDDAVRERADTNRHAREALENALRRHGLEPVESVANFVCVPLGRDGREVYDALLDHGVIVRPLAPFGMADAVRITVGTPEETEIAIAALEQVLPALANA
jgi:histidinol-phosphate aminotransferase